MNNHSLTPSVKASSCCTGIIQRLRVLLAGFFLLFVAHATLNAQCQTCCNGSKPKTLVLLYNGLSCGSTVTCQAAGKWSCSGGGPNNAATVYITATKNSDGSGGTYFAGNVALNAEFTVNASAGGSSTFPANTYFRVFSSQGGTLLQSVGIHTSCSTPLVAGDQLGAIKIQKITLADNTNCGAPTPPEQCPSPSVTVVQQGVTITTNAVTGNISNLIISASTNDSYQKSDGANKPSNYEEGNIRHKGFRFPNLNIPAGAVITSAQLKLVGYSGGNVPVTIKAENVKAPTAYTSAANYLSSRSVTSTSANWSIPSLTNGTQLTSPDLSAVVQQVVTAQNGITDLSLILSNTSGTWVTWNFDDGPSYASKFPVLNLTYVVNSVSPNSNVCKGQTATFSTTASPYSCLNYSWNFGAGASPQTATGIGPHQVTYSTVGTPTATLSVSNDCQGGAGTTVCEQVGGGGNGVDCCDAGDKPKSLTLVYNGESCANTSTSQGADKYSCANVGAGPNGDPSVYIKVAEKEDGSGKQYFTGDVAINGSFTVNAATASATEFKANTWFLIYASQGGALLQKVKIHTSCSTPIVSGDQFGSLVLQSVEFKNGASCGPTGPSCLDCQVTVSIPLNVVDCVCVGQGGDTDGDGVCNNQDCAPTNPNLPTTPGTTCNDGNPNTVNDVIQADGCSCAGTFNPCVSQGGDTDGDGVCNNQDCAPTNPNLPTTPGTTCNDGNPNTVNDVIQADGCSCAGTPVGGPDCVNGINITASNGTITVTGLDGSPVSSLQIFDANWQQVFNCFANCGATQTVSLPPGNYNVFAKYYSASYQLICEKQLNVTVGSNPVCDNIINGGTIGFGANCTNTIQYCPSNGPAPTISSCVDPSGGTGNLEIVWLKSTTSCNPPTTTAEQIAQGLDPHWTMIPGATGLTYTPSNVTQQTCYLRCSRRANCPVFIESNIITLAIPSNCVINNTPNCANIGINPGPGKITVTGLDGAPVTSVQILSAAWQPEHQCFGNCGTPSAVFNVPAGTHYVYVKYYTAQYQLICEVTQTINVTQALAADPSEKFRFEAIKNLEHVELIWMHDGDFNVSNYVLERSFDGKNFEEIAMVESDKSNAADVYEGFDLEPFTGANYYRVKMFNEDGTIDLSLMQEVYFEDLMDFEIFPNPANSFTSINLESAFGKKGVDIHIYNSMGLRMRQYHLEEVWSKYHQMDLRDLHEGRYTVWVNVPGKRPRAVQLVIGRI